MKETTFVLVTLTIILGFFILRLLETYIYGPSPLRTETRNEPVYEPPRPIDDFEKHVPSLPISEVSSEDSYLRKDTFEPSQNASYSLTLPNKTSKGCRLCAEICNALFPNKTVYYNFRDQKIFNDDTGAALEIDIFYPELSFGIEFNGIQHYQNVEHFGSGATFQSARDHQKICKAMHNGICIVSIPYSEISESSIRKTISEAYINFATCIVK